MVTTVHWPDDTRIRERLIRTLAEDFEVSYATKSPGPSDRSDLTWLPLRGGRLRRNLGALRVCLAQDWDVLVFHDPELLSVGILSRLFRRRPVVFDVHEDFSAVATTRGWLPTVVRRPASACIRVALRVAESFFILTLAEENYRRLFRHSHAVFPNFPDTSRYPEPTDGDGSVVYLGDVTLERGAGVAMEAVALHGRQMTFIGRVSDQLETQLRESAGNGVNVEFTNELPNPLALDRVRTAGVAIAPLLDIPNYRHSAPTKILEYLALGVPVVASDLPGTRNLVEGLDAVELVPPGDSEQLARAIDHSLVPELREAAVAQVEKIRERYRWPSEDVLGFYHSLLT